MGRVFRLSERSGERLKSRHRYCIIERSEFGRPEVWRSEHERRASIFRFRSPHRGKSFGIAADAEMTDVLPGVCYWSFIPYIPLIADFIAE